MALTQIQIPPGGSRVIWAKLSQAAKLVAQGRAVYTPEPPAKAPEAPPVTAPAAKPKKGGR